ncbi:MAG: sigma-70 family RNA polymerase sigma factor [Planctomycetota bacterium]
MTLPTRHSLLVRIKDNSDTEAWVQFVDLYGPLLFRFAKKKGLQEADAADVMQEALQRVSQSISKFDYDPNLGRFRSWLYLIASQCISKQWKQQTKQPIGSGDSVMARMIEQTPVMDDEAVWENEYRQYLLNWAIEQIQDQFSKSTWSAFTLTALEHRPADEVADKLNISVGAVYIAKSRVTKRLKEKVASIDQSLESTST